uniref:AlNc14C55G4192 protein n=1 Tax=Albugo laibachii Nc14 TaxID=890382 RepID=F0WC05_9STRA|nr:AlNc14C55G4192 [Albugo laibachii Nc14]|eukprot:CCA18686.1 AlNc14C55G4192 [Albugo laibachii Nc14]
MCPSTSAIHTARYIESIQIRSVPFDNSIADTVYGIQYKNNRVALVQSNELQSLTPALQAKEVANKK